MKYYNATEYIRDKQKNNFNLSQFLNTNKKCKRYVEQLKKEGYEPFKSTIGNKGVTIVAEPIMNLIIVSLDIMLIYDKKFNENIKQYEV